MVTSNNIDPPPLQVRRVTYDKILLFGDSLTELSSDVLTLSFALTPALQHHYFRKLSVVARGYGGYSSEHLRHVLVPTLRAETAGGEEIKLLVIEVGTNDAAKNDMQFVPVGRYGENLRRMVETAKAEGIQNLILVGLGPVDKQKLEAPIDKTIERNLEYSEAARAIAERCGVPFVNLWRALLLSAGWMEGQRIPESEEGLGRLLTDGVHLSGDGYRVWYNELLETVRANFPALKTENLPTVLPHIFDVEREKLPDTLWQVVQIRK